MSLSNLSVRSNLCGRLPLYVKDISDEAQPKLLLLTNPFRFPNVTQSARLFGYRTDAEWTMPADRVEV